MRLHLLLDLANEMSKLVSTGQDNFIDDVGDSIACLDVFDDNDGQVMVRISRSLLGLPERVQTMAATDSLRRFSIRHRDTPDFLGKDRRYRTDHTFEKSKSQRAVCQLLQDTQGFCAYRLHFKSLNLITSLTTTWNNKISVKVSRSRCRNVFSQVWQPNNCWKALLVGAKTVKSVSSSSTTSSRPAIFNALHKILKSPTLQATSATKKEGTSTKRFVVEERLAMEVSYQHNTMQIIKEKYVPSVVPQLPEGPDGPGARVGLATGLGSGEGPGKITFSTT